MGFIEPTGIDERPGKVGVIPGVGRFRGYGMLETSDRLVSLLGGLVNSAKCVVGFRFVGLELFGFECKLQCFNVAVLPK